MKLKRCTMHIEIGGRNSSRKHGNFTSISKITWGMILSAAKGTESVKGCGNGWGGGAKQQTAFLPDDRSGVLRWEALDCGEQLGEKIVVSSLAVSGGFLCLPLRGDTPVVTHNTPVCGGTHHTVCVCVCGTMHMQTYRLHVHGTHNALQFTAGQLLGILCAHLPTIISLSLLGDGSS